MRIGLPTLIALLAGCSASVGDDVESSAVVDAEAASGEAAPGARDGSIASPEVTPLPPLASPACPAPAGTTTTDLGQYLTRLGNCHFSARAARLAALKTPADVLARRDYVRQRIVEEIGGFPEKTPLNVQKAGGDNGVPVFVGDGYRVEKIIYESQPHFYVTANVWTPAASVPVPPGGFPAVIGTAGHCSWGKQCYEHLWAPLAKMGFVVLAFDPPGQAERCELDPNVGRNGWEHIVVGPPLVLTGMNYARYEIWDAIRAIDYLESRPDVDPKRIGVTGSSGGGTQSFYLAAFEPRVVAAVPIASMSSWPAYWNVGHFGDSEQVFTNFIRDGLDVSDFPLAMAAAPGGAPRAFKFIQGATDPEFPIGTADGKSPGAFTTASEGEAFYRLLGQAERFEFFAHTAGHTSSTFDVMENTFQWLQRWLVGSIKKTPDAGALDALFYCTKSNSVYQDIPDAKTVQMMNGEIAKQQHAGRSASKALTAEQMRALVAARIVAAGDRTRTPVVKPNGAVTMRDGYSQGPILIETEPGFFVRAALLLPSGVSAPAPAVLYAGKAPSATAAVDPDAEALVRAGHVVLVVEPRGTGEVVHVDPIQSDTSSSTAYTYSMKALALGRPLVGMKVTDILRSFDVLRSRKEVDPARVALFGKKAAGLAALHAAILEPGIQKVAVEDVLVSYLDVTAVKVPTGTLDLLVPGVLKDYDLPDLAKAMSPRPVWIVSARGAAGSPTPLSKAQELYGPTGARVVARAGSFTSTYDEWLKAGM